MVVSFRLLSLETLCGSRNPVVDAFLAARAGRGDKCTKPWHVREQRRCHPLVNRPRGSFARERKSEWLLRIGVERRSSSVRAGSLF